jgi:curved DNA-binding protein CbpA
VINKQKHFDILGISPTSDEAQIKKAYRKQALKYHPDKNDSPNAHQQFIKVTEAYEVLTGQGKPKRTKQNPTTVHQKTKEEILASKVKRAKERWKKQQEEEFEKDRTYYEKVTSGWGWRLFQAMAIYSAIWSTLLSIDYFTIGEQVCVTGDLNPDPYDRVARVRGEKFNIDSQEYWAKRNYNIPIRGEYTYLFHDLKSISIQVNYEPRYHYNSNSARMNRLQPFDKDELFTVVSYDSIYGAFPFMHLLFFIPVILIFFKRQNLRFNIWRLVSFWIIYPAIIYFTLSNDRIFYLAELLLN